MIQIYFYEICYFSTKQYHIIFIFYDLVGVLFSVKMVVNEPILSKCNEKQVKICRNGKAFISIKPLNIQDRPINYQHKLMDFNYYLYFYYLKLYEVSNYLSNLILLIFNNLRHLLKKIELRIVGLSYSQAQANSYALVLGELSGKRRLPIVIGHYEAQAIALEIEKMKASRPLTHDLFFNFAKTFGISMIEVQITKFHEGIFHATLVCDNGISVREIDSRTSDAVALSIRFHCPIFTTEEVLDQAGILFEEEEDQLNTKTDSPAEGAVPLSLRNLSLAELETDLEQAIVDEDYEKASLIRDEIKRRK